MFIFIFLLLLLVIITYDFCYVFETWIHFKTKSNQSEYLSQKPCNNFNGGNTACPNPLITLYAPMELTFNPTPTPPAPRSNNPICTRRIDL